MLPSYRKPRKRRVWREPTRNTYEPWDPPPSFGVVLRRLWAEGIGKLVARCPPARGLEPKRSEKVEQTALKQMFNGLGYVAYFDTSQPFHPAITPGLPDLLCFDTRCTPWRLFFVEAKRRGAWQSPSQRLFEHCCQQVGIDYVLGGVQEVGRYLGLECYG
jgi:hypothetical protein